VCVCVRACVRGGQDHICHIISTVTSYFYHSIVAPYVFANFTKVLKTSHKSSYYGIFVLSESLLWRQQTTVMKYLSRQTGKRILCGHINMQHLALKPLALLIISVFIDI